MFEDLINKWRRLVLCASLTFSVFYTTTMGGCSAFYDLATIERPGGGALTIWPAGAGPCQK